MRPDTIPSSKSSLFDLSNLNGNDFDTSELVDVLKKMRKGKSAGDDGIPPDFWRLCLNSEKFFSWLLYFCITIWHSEKVPEQWRSAQVKCLFKKGDPTYPDNYRPISLLQKRFKKFSALILNRLKGGGVEEVLWVTQFDFRGKRSTQYAILIIKRLIERAFNHQNLLFHLSCS